ncbi:MAG: protoporphyrinogen oxidase [Legionella sp.]|nr:MAG: protoporphyrinogen oxidase [Legionella sp.]
MIRIIVIFAVLLASVYLGLWLQHEPGYVVVMIHHWTIEATFWVALIALICFIVLTNLVLSTLKYISALPHAWQQWRAQRRLNKAQTKTKRGLIEFSEGHWKTAKKHLISAAADTDLPLINYLTAARAAEELGEPALRDHYLHQAQAAEPDASIAIELTQATLQLDHHQWAEAAITLQNVQALSPDHPYALKLLLRLYQATQNWSELIHILPKLTSHSIIAEHSLREIAQNAYVQALQIYVQQHNDDEVDLLISHLPKELRHNPEITATYSRYLLSKHQDEAAESRLRDSLQHQLNNQLLDCYGQVHITKARIPFIESLLKKNPNFAPLHTCLGQLFAAQQLWGAAKTHLTQSIHIQPSFEAYYELGKLSEALDDQNAACHSYRQASECIKKQNLGVQHGCFTTR